MGKAALFILLRTISCKFNFLVAYWYYRLISELEHPVCTTYCVFYMSWHDGQPNETDLQGQESVSLHLILIFLGPDWQRVKKKDYLTNVTIVCITYFFDYCKLEWNKQTNKQKTFLYRFIIRLILYFNASLYFIWNIFLNLLIN